MPEPKLSIAQFAAEVKSKYPQYKDIDDSVLANKMIEKYPVYADKVELGVKKKEPSEASVSQPSEEPSASVISPSVPAAFGAIPKIERTQEVEKPSDSDTPNWYNVAKSALSRTYEVGKSALLKAASYASPTATPLTREIIDVEAQAALNKIREEGPKFEQSFTESISQGKFGDAALQAEEFLLGTAPLAATSAAITVGTGGAGAPIALALMGGYGAQSAHLEAKGQKFYEEMSPLMRAGYTGAMGGLEILGEGVGGKILSKAAMKLAAQELSKEAFDQTAKEIVKGALKSNGVAITEEALAEFTTGFGQSAIDQYARTGNIDFKEALRQGGEGAAMGAVGGGVFNVPSTVADATALANSVGRDLKNVKARTEINKFKEKLDASSTVEEQDYYAQKLAEAIKTRTRNASEDAKFYEYVGTQSPQDLEQFLEIDNEIKRYSSMAKVIKDAEAIKDIKAKVGDLVQQQKDLESKYAGYDSQEEAGVPSPVIEGEAIVEAQPVEGAGEQAPEAGGVLQVPIEEGAEVVAPIEATVFAAPFYDTKVNNIEEARTIRQSESYVKNLDIIRNASALFNVEIDNVDESIGGFVNDAGDKIVEVSNIIRVKGTPEDIENYAAFLATSAPETQEATIAATYVEPDSDTHNIDELTISVSDIDGAIEALKDNDIYDFTINDSNNTITFLDFSKGGDDEFVEKIGNFTNSLEAKNISYEQQAIRAIDSKYIGPSERSGILGRIQEALVQQGQTGTELYRQVQQAIDRNNKFLAKAQPTTEVGVEQAQPEPSAEVVVEETIQEPSGITVDDVYNSYKESIKPKISPKTFIESAKKQLIDRQSKIKNAVIDLGLRNAYDRIVNKAGASARANDKYNRAEKNIYGGLNEKDIETLDKIIFNRRVIQIDENFDKRRLDADARVKSAQNELSNWMSSNIGKKSEVALEQKKEIQDKLSQAKRDVEASKRPKHPLGFKSEDARRDLDALKQSLGEEKYNDLVRRSDLYFDEFRSTLKDLYDAGLVSEEMYNDLRTNNYQPRKFLEHVYDFENSEFLIRDSGLSQEQIKAIQEGSEKDLIMSSRFLLGSYLLSASKRIFANRANKAIAQAIGKEGSNDWVRSLDEKADPDAGFSKVYYFENGAQQQFQLRSDLKKELDNLSSLSNVDGKVGKFFSMMSGTPLIKLMATRANPLFAFKNFPRDLGHILFFTNIYDKHNLYYATYLVFRDFLKGLKSSIQDTQDFKEYMDLGGGMDFISIQGRDGNFISKSAINKTVEKIGKLGEWSEVGFRIGVYKRFKDDAIAEFEKKNGAKPEGEDLLQIKERAVAKAREIIDFSQGGEAVKAADKFVPYLNAAFQGFRVGATYVANNPKKFASKFVQAQMGLLALSFLNSLIGDEDELEDIPEHTRLMNFVMFLPSTRIDEDGKERRKYILIPKTQQAAPFFALMDVANRKILNDVFGKEYSISEDEYTYIVNGIRKGLPIGDDAPIKEIQSLIPVINAATTYSSNYDSFRDRMITMDKGKVLPAFENINDPNVEQFYKVIGEVAGISPIRTKVAAEKLITGPNSSFIVGMSYGLLDAIARQYPLEGGEYDIKTAESKAQNVAKQTGLNFSKAFVRETDPSWKLYNQKETLDEIDLRAGTERARLRQKAKELAQGNNTTASLNKSVAEAEKFAIEVAKKNPSDARYFVESFRANVKKSPASQEAVEIKFSTTDKSRAEKIKLLYNPQNREDFIKIAGDVYRETGYRVSSKTFNEYEKLYGKLK